MNSFAKELKTKPYFACSDSVKEEEIDLAEKRLGLVFTQEYRDYVLKYGIASIQEHEFTGITTSKRLNVVEVTISARSQCPQMSNQMYVIEQYNIDGIYICQDSTGSVYQTSPKMQPVKLCNSLAEYIQM